MATIEPTGAPSSGGAISGFTFPDGERSAHRLGTATPGTARNHILDNVVDQAPGRKGGATCGHVLEKNLQHFGWRPGEEAAPGVLGLSRPVQRGKKRSNAIVMTDGENDPADEARTIRVLEDSELRGDNVDSKVLRDIVRRFRSTGAVIVRDLEGIVETGGDEISAELWDPELIEWLKGWEAAGACGPRTRPHRRDRP